MTATLMVLLGRAETATACLEAAGRIAGSYDRAALVVLHVRLDPLQAVLPGEEVLTARRRREIEGAETARAVALTHAFDEWRARASPAALAARWVEITGDPAR